jgi:hypothetical protein
MVNRWLYIQAAELRFEKVDDAGYRQHHHKRNHEDPRVEMPSPDSAIKVVVLSSLPNASLD